MAGLDEGVGNLERFIEGLQKASSELGEHSSALESAENELERLEGEAQDTVGGFADDLGEAQGALQQALDDAREAVGEVAEAAQDGADGRLADAEDEVDQSAGDCEEQITQGRAGMDEGFARLSESGFDGYSSAIEEATTEIGQSDDTNREAFDGLEQSVSDMRGRLDEASSEAVEALEEAASETQGTDGELQSAFETITSEWKDSIDEQLREGCEETGGALATAYASWGEETGSVADALVDQVEEVLDGAAEFVGSESASALAEARATGLDDPGAELLQQFDDTQQTLEAGEALAEALEGFVPDLQKCINVVDEVDRLLNALE